MSDTWPTFLSYFVFGDFQAHTPHRGAHAHQPYIHLAPQSRIARLWPMQILYASRHRARVASCGVVRAPEIHAPIPHVTHATHTNEGATRSISTAGERPHSHMATGSEGTHPIVEWRAIQIPAVRSKANTKSPTAPPRQLRRGPALAISPRPPHQQKILKGVERPVASPRGSMADD